MSLMYGKVESLAVSKVVGVWVGLGFLFLGESLTACRMTDLMLRGNSRERSFGLQ